MAHLYNKHRHGNAPKWQKSLDQYKEESMNADSRDTNRLIKNYDTDPKVTRDASYVSAGKKGK